MTNDHNDYGEHGEWLGTPSKKVARTRIRFPRILPYLSSRQVNAFLTCAVILCAYLVGLMVETTETIEEVFQGPVAMAIVALVVLVVIWYLVGKHSHSHQHHPN